MLGFFLKKKRTIICLQDLFPQNAIDLSILKNKILIKILFIIEKKIFEINDYFIVHSNNAQIFLKKKYKPFRKLFQQKYKERFNCILLPFNALLKVVKSTI